MSWMRRVSNDVIFLNLIRRFNASNQNHKKLFCGYCQIDIWKDKRQAISNILKKSKVETMTLPNFKKYYKVTEIKTVQ